MRDEQTSRHTGDGREREWIRERFAYLYCIKIAAGDANDDSQRIVSHVVVRQNTRLENTVTQDWSQCRAEQYGTQRTAVYAMHAIDAW